jgi:acetyl esterase/lipase
MQQSTAIFTRVLAFFGVLFSVSPDALASEAEPVSPDYAIQRDIAYGDHPQQVFDLYRSGLEKGSTGQDFTIIFAHGGGYYLSDKSEEEHYIKPFLARGFNVINTNYRIKQGAFTATDDLARLLRYLAAHRTEHGLDMDRVVLMGFSAGGQMSANIGFWQNEENSPFDIPQEVGIAGVINVSGPSHNFAEVEQIFLNFDYPLFQELGAALLPEDPNYSKDELIELLEPLNHFDGQDPPLFLWYGGKDVQVPPSTHERLVMRLDAESTASRIVYVPDGEHSPTAEQAQAAFDQIWDFLERL